jgi:YfiH family protein
MEQTSITWPEGQIPLIISSRMPGNFIHGFTTRHGGVSAPPFASFNLGWKWGDDPFAVDENHRRLLAISGAKVMLRASQVHKARILRVHAEDDPIVVAKEQADGLVTLDPGIGISVHVADCTPILLACPRTGAVAALHAGWRGTVAGIAKYGMKTLAAEYGCQPKEIYAALGPCIGGCCFEVGPEVIDAFLEAMPDAQDHGVVLISPQRKPRVDLRQFQRIQLETAGLDPQNIDVSTDCTLCDPAKRFYSFRKSGRVTGQLVGFILRKE